MPKKAKKDRPIKVKWEFIHTSDAEARIEAAFDIVFSLMEADRAGDEGLSSDPAPESVEGQDQLLLF